MPTVIDLGRAIKAKYPQYADIDDAVLGRSVRAKYPQYGDYKDTITAGTGRTGPRLKGEPKPGAAGTILPIATATMLGGPILGEGAALLPLSELGAAARQGALTARATAPAVNPVAAISALPGVEALSEALGVPRGLGAAAEMGATYLPKAAGFVRGAGRYLRQEPFGPEFRITPPVSRPGPLWSGMPEPGPSSALEFQPIQATQLPSGRVPGQPSTTPAASQSTVVDITGSPFVRSNSPFTGNPMQFRGMSQPELPLQEVSPEMQRIGMHHVVQFANDNGIPFAAAKQHFLDQGYLPDWNITGP